MRTELTLSGKTMNFPTTAVREGGGGGDGKVTFTPEQQAKIDEIVRERMGVAGREGREEAERARAAEKAAKDALDAAKSELDAFKKKQPKAGEGTDEIEQLKAQIVEMRQAGESTKSEVDRLRQLVSAKEKELESSKQQTTEIRKENALRDAAAECNFLEPEVVITLTKNSVKWDETRGKFVVLGENGTERLNSAYEPMTLKEFYAEYASKKPYMVRGDIRSGAGSGESNRAVSNNGKHAVEDIFGPKSSGAKANALKKNNPAEYARLKVIARENGLIA